MKKLLNKLISDEDLSKELTQLIDTANAPIFGIDTAGNVNEWNQKVEQITGFNKDEVMGHNLVKTQDNGGIQKTRTGSSR